jgi:hypothetical protein
MQAIKGFVLARFFYFTYLPAIVGIATWGLWFEQTVKSALFSISSIERGKGTIC